MQHMTYLHHQTSKNFEFLFKKFLKVVSVGRVLKRAICSFQDVAQPFFLIFIFVAN